MGACEPEVGEEESCSDPSWMSPHLPARNRKGAVSGAVNDICTYQKKKKRKSLKMGEEGAAAGDGGCAPLLLRENVGVNYYSSKSSENVRNGV